MSKCISCGIELMTGDIHWEQGLCNQCWNVQHYPDPYFEITCDKRLLSRREEYIQSLEQQLAEKDHRIALLEKALELAVGCINCLCCPLKANHCARTCSETGIYNYFIEQAKKEMEGEE